MWYPIYLLWYPFGGGRWLIYIEENDLRFSTKQSGLNFSKFYTNRLFFEKYLSYRNVIYAVTMANFHRTLTYRQLFRWLCRDQNMVELLQKIKTSLFKCCIRMVWFASSLISYWKKKNTHTNNNPIQSIPIRIPETHNKCYLIFVRTASPPFDYRS